jgi:inorganic pyrophosphatase
MSLSDITAGDKAPEEVNVIVEIPLGCHDKLEFDKEKEVFFVDRALHTDMTYPGNYGFIPHTLGGDEDPVDCLLVAEYPLYPGVVVKARPVAVLMTEDEKGKDEKIVAIPLDNPHFSDIKDENDLSDEVKDKIKYFFENYKKHEKNKWVKVTGWESAKKAKEMIQEGIDNHANI